MKNETGRSMVEMMMVLALMGVLTIGGIMAYKDAQNKNKANTIHELVSIASLNSLTKMKLLSDVSCPGEKFRDFNNDCVDGRNIWNVIGKEKTDYKCISSLKADSRGKVQIIFAGCDKVKKILTTQWGDFWNEGTNTYTPPKDDE